MVLLKCSVDMSSVPGAAQTLVAGSSLSYCHLSLGGPLVLVALEDVSCGGEKSVYEKGCRLN
jgi:hypothetical protein